MFPGLFLLVLFYASSASHPPRGCGPCDPSRCAPLPIGGCSSGPPVRDPCGCCEMCAAGPGDPCSPRGAGAARCAAGLECTRSDRKSKTGVCVCKSGSFPVCGSDGRGYENMCELKEASARAVDENKPEIRVKTHGRCGHAPLMVTAPGEIWNVTGSQVFLTCEATGIPTPVLTWRKVGSNAPLPGDRENIAVQSRGGPEKQQLTGWLLVSPLTKDEDGAYECQATNTHGEASASGFVHVVETLEDIPDSAGQKSRD